ncbi:MAG: hypothetical protein IJB51_07940 [Clostridia bacterium]|nr:hypothetical protein [Clostridia bacterium]
MKKAIRLLFFMLLLTVPAFATEDASSWTEEFSVLISDALEEAKPAAKDAAEDAVRLLGVALITGIAHSFSDGKEGVMAVIRAFGVSTALILTIGDAKGFVNSVASVTDDMLVVLQTSLPTLTSVSAMAGGSASAVTSQAVYLLSADIAALLIHRLLLPLLGVYLALSVTMSVFPQKLPGGADKAVAGLITFLLRLFLTIFIGYTGILKVFGAVTDSVAKRSLKLALSSSVPVIGTIAAEAADSIYAIAGTTRSYIGITGLIALLSVFLIPMGRMCIYYLVFRFFSFLIAPIGGDGIGSFMESLCNGYGLLLAIAGSIILLALLSILSAFAFISP